MRFIEITHTVKPPDLCDLVFCVMLRTLTQWNPLISVIWCFPELYDFCVSLISVIGCSLDLCVALILGMNFSRTPAMPSWLPPLITSFSFFVNEIYRWVEIVVTCWLGNFLLRVLVCFCASSWASPCWWSPLNFNSRLPMPSLTSPLTVHYISSRLPRCMLSRGVSVISPRDWLHNNH